MFLFFQFAAITRFIFIIWITFSSHHSWGWKENVMREEDLGANFGTRFRNATKCPEDAEVWTGEGARPCLQLSILVSWLLRKHNVWTSKSSKFFSLGKCIPRFFFLSHNLKHTKCVGFIRQVLYCIRLLPYHHSIALSVLYLFQLEGGVLWNIWMLFYEKRNPCKNSKISLNQTILQQEWAKSRLGSISSFSFVSHPFIQMQK